MKRSARLILPAVMLLSICGTALVGCKKSSNTDSSSQSEVATLTVSPKNAKVYLNDESATVQLTATLTNSSEKLNWSSSDTSVATVSDNGLVTGLKLGSATITVKTESGNLSATSTVTVKQDRSQEDTINDLNKPAFLTNYEKRTNTLDKVEEIQTNKDPDRTAFYENEQKTRDFYKVGNQNEFKAQITGKAVDERGRDEDIANPFTKIAVELYDEGQSKYVAIPESELAQHVAINANHNGYQFTENAAGNRYKITVSVDETKYASVSEYCSDVVMEVEVFNGYNVYTKEQLSVFDNFKTQWNSIKEANGLTGVEAKGIALHANLTIGNDDIPAEFKYSLAEVNDYMSKYSDDFNNWYEAKKANRPTDQQEAFTKDAAKALLVDSVKDWTTVYNRRTHETDDFAFEGNYFTVDTSGIKQIHSFESGIEKGELKEKYSPSNPLVGTNGSHGQLFGLNTDVGPQDGQGGNYQFNNVTIIGNGDRSDDDNYLGGLITFKTKGDTLLFKNVLSSKTFITFMAEKHDMAGTIETKMYLDRCKNFDSYNSLLYIWGTDTNVITNSFMNGAGGAIALLDDVNADQGSRTDITHGAPKVDCYNVYLENLLTGTEPWFVNHKATALVQMMGLFGTPDKWLGRNALAHGDHMNITTFNDKSEMFIDLVAIDICGGNPLGNSLAEGGSMLQGHFNIYNDPEMTSLFAGLDMAKMAAANPASEDFQTQVAMQYMMGNHLPLYRAAALQNSAQGIVIETSAGGYGMLYDENFQNGVVLTLDESFNVNPMPFYNYPPYGDGTAELAYNNGLADNMNNLAKGEYASIYLQPSASTEYLGAFIKMHKMGA